MCGALAQFQLIAVTWPSKGVGTTMGVVGEAEEPRGYDGIGTCRQSSARRSTCSSPELGGPGASGIKLCLTCERHTTWPGGMRDDSSKFPNKASKHDGYGGNFARPRVSSK